MHINSINNITFNERFKLAKISKNPKIVEGLALTGLGATSTFITLDSLNVIPSTFVETSADSTIISSGETCDGTTAFTFLESAPLGAFHSSLGSSSLYSGIKENQKTRKIPN